MTFFDEFADMMPHSITITPRTGEDHGEPVFGGSPITYAPCQVLEGPVRYRNDEGDTIIGNGQAIVAGTPDCPADGKASLPGGRIAPIVHVERYPDETGVVVQRIVFG